MTLMRTVGVTMMRLTGLRRSVRKKDQGDGVRRDRDEEVEGGDAAKVVAGGLTSSAEPE